MIDRHPRPERHESRDEAIRDREIDRYPMAPENLKALRAIGTFRVVDRKDLDAGNLNTLLHRGFIQRQTLSPPEGGTMHEILSLTPKGREKLRKQGGADELQRYWVGSVKPREAEHDLEIYRAYKLQAAAIEKAGGKIKRVVVDFEFKSKINSRMNKPGPATKDERRKESAKEFDLPIVDGRLMLPDARIEYTDATGHERHLDLEVITRTYRGSKASAVSRSGFTPHHQTSGRNRIHTRKGGKAVRDEHHAL
jgi:hypothetical protein